MNPHIYVSLSVSGIIATLEQVPHEGNILNVQLPLSVAPKPKSEGRGSRLNSAC